MPSSLLSAHNIRFGEADQNGSRTALTSSSQAFCPSSYAVKDASLVPVATGTALSASSHAFCPSAFAAPANTNDAPVVQVVPTNQFHSIYPAAKGALQCFCRGEVERMLESYGWLLLHGKVSHPSASKRGGRIYISKDDVVQGRTLQVGDIVTFYLYVDEQGLGAEVCDIEQSAAVRYNCQSSLHHGNLQDWQPMQWQSQTQPCYYVPVPVVVAQMPNTQQQYPVLPCSPTIDEKLVSKEDIVETEKQAHEFSKTDIAGESEVTDRELPSVGSAGHFDGTCKRCAFFPKGRCRNGADCTHCHFEHVPRPRLKSQRTRNSSPNASSDRMGTMEENSQDWDESYVVGDSDADDVSQPYDESAPTKSSTSSNSGKDCEELPGDADYEVSNEACSTAPLESGLRTPSVYGDEQEEGEKDTMISRDDNKAEIVSELILLDLPKDVKPLAGDATDAETRTPSTSAPSDDDETRPMSSTSSAKSPATASSVSSKRRLPSRCGPETKPQEERKSSGGSSCDAAFRQRKGSHFAASPTSWSAQQRLRRESTNSLESDQSSEEVARMARALLNKLTKSKFESLSTQILALPFSTPEQLSVVAAEIFEKATTQDGFRSLYVDLCMRLNTHLAQQSSDVSDKDFRKALANECQAIFERSLQPPNVAIYDGMTEAERFELDVKVKTRRLGNMRFIGELLVKRLLAQKLMVPIMFELLNGDEAALESLIALMSVVAPEFDHKNKPSPYQAPLQDAFSTLHRKIQDKSISARLRFQLRDLFDARAKGWA